MRCCVGHMGGGWCSMVVCCVWGMRCGVGHMSGWCSMVVCCIWGMRCCVGHMTCCWCCVMVRCVRGM